MRSALGLNRVRLPAASAGHDAVADAVDHGTHRAALLLQAPRRLPQLSLGDPEPGDVAEHHDAAAQRAVGVVAAGGR